MKKVLFLLTLLSSFPLFAQKTRTVGGEAVYYVPENVTLTEAKRTALDRAMTQALANEFNMTVSQNNTTRIKNRDGHSESDFISFGGSEVKGEWIETIGEPEYNIRYEGEQLIVSCKVRGKAREIVSAAIDYKAKILRNGIEDKFESDRFKHGDNIFLSFQSPVKGFLAVYLEDEDGQVACLLPYRGQKDGIYPIEANRRYLFFDARTAPAIEKAIVDEYVMLTARSSEFNRIYIVFSPNQFTKASDDSVQENLPRQLSLRDFKKWLAKCKTHDTQMNVKPVGITIEK